MKILFIEVDTESKWAVASIGPAYIAAFLRKHGHHVDFVRVGVSMDPSELIDRIRETSPDVLALSLTSRQWQRGRTLIRAIHTAVGVPVVAGGLHPTFSPEEVLHSPGFDYICLGEGEEAMLELVEALEAGRPTDEIPNIWAQGGARPPLRQPFAPLDDLPFMARDLLDEPPGVVHMATQRGCPFPCTYCAARMYSQLYDEAGSDYGRRRSHESVLEELFAIRRGGNLAYVIFLDDTFTINRPWVKEFCRIHGEQLGVPFSLNARVETVDAAMLKMLADAGCRHIIYGVESGSLRVRTEILRRPMSNQRFKDVFRWTKEAGIMVTANYMLGLPGETREDIKQTLELAEELNAYDFGYFVFYPYPGTQLFQSCLDNGYLPTNYTDLPASHRESVLNLPNLSPDHIEEFYGRFTALRERVSVERVSVTTSPEYRRTVSDQVRAHARTG